MRPSCPARKGVTTQRRTQHPPAGQGRRTAASERHHLQVGRAQSSGWGARMRLSAMISLANHHKRLNLPRRRTAVMDQDLASGIERALFGAVRRDTIDGPSPGSWRTTHAARSASYLAADCFLAGRGCTPSRSTATHISTFAGNPAVRNRRRWTPGPTTSCPALVLVRTAGIPVRTGAVLPQSANEEQR